MSQKPVGYIKKLLAIDCETSGLFYNLESPAYNPQTGQYYQPVSIGLVVVDADTFNAIEELYVEIAWDGMSLWSTQAEKIHGLSKSYLEENGVSTLDAIEQIGNLIINHWGPSSPVHILGQNPWFDLCFLRSVLEREGINIKFGNKLFDSNSVGFAVFGTYNSKDLFDLLGTKQPLTHNALIDARNAVEVFKKTRLIADQCFGG
ncbi:MAG: 3'-5' exonuclease [Nitrososphaeraceae archaeon]